jgi:hypothetical protein
MRTIACLVVFTLCLGCRELIKVSPYEETPAEPAVETAAEPEPAEAEPREIDWFGAVSVHESVTDFDKECDDKGECCYFWPTQYSYPEVKLGEVDLTDYEEA